MPEFTFEVIQRRDAIPRKANATAYLLSDAWDDWFTFETQFRLYVFDQDGERHDIGNVKIGQFDMKAGERTPGVPTEFETLPIEFFSLGQDESYYTALNAMGGESRDTILSSLRDLAIDDELFDRAKAEKVTQRSLMRFVPEATVTGQFRRLASGGARLTSYAFSYRLPRRQAGAEPPVLTFSVVPESQPPTNVHVIIGRNGAGKTNILSNMVRALCAEPAAARQAGRFGYESQADADEESESRFANLVSVSFSAFDNFEPIGDRQSESDDVRFTYIGLRRAGDRGKTPGATKTPEMLAGEFVRSMRVCQIGARLLRWKHTLSKLEHDPIFQEAGVSQWAELSGDEGEKIATSQFNLLSSGHKIVLLTMTRLVESVEERTLVLIDEPEAHLHPPLLSAFIRALSHLLVARNGVAVAATHSPVILQEVPRSCVWKLRRSGADASVSRPQLETFGENLGILTREVFGLEITQTGFYSHLTEVCNGLSFEQAVAKFNGQLGSEALAHLRVMCLEDVDVDTETSEHEDE